MATAWAEAALGRMYWKGQGVAQDYVEAAKLLRTAVEQVQVVGQVTIAAMIIAGTVGLHHYAEAAKWRLPPE
jgi:TPR repeat protein